MACPHVAGAAALLLARSPNMTPQQLKAELQEHTTPGKVKDAKANSPNKFLFVESAQGPTTIRPTTTATTTTTTTTTTQEKFAIRWPTHPDKCLDVSGGVNRDGTNIQLWDCVNDGEHTNMQSVPPASVRNWAQTLGEAPNQVPGHICRERQQWRKPPDLVLREHG